MNVQANSTGAKGMFIKGNALHLVIVVLCFAVLSACDAESSTAQLNAGATGLAGGVSEIGAEFQEIAEDISESSEITKDNLPEVISGLSASGVPLSYSNVIIKDANGYTIAKGRTGVDGHFAVAPVIDAESSDALRWPLLFRVERARDFAKKEVQYSILTRRMLTKYREKNGPDAQIHVNVTSLTHAAMVLAMHANAKDIYSFPKNQKLLEEQESEVLEGNLFRISENVVEMLSVFLHGKGADSISSGYDLFTGKFVANGTEMDAVLDALTIDFMQDSVVLRPKSSKVRSIFRTVFDNDLLIIGGDVTGARSIYSVSDQLKGSLSENSLRKSKAQEIISQPDVPVVVFSRYAQTATGNNSCGGGLYSGEVSLVNTTDAPISDWKLSLYFPSDIRLIWNAADLRTSLDVQKGRYAFGPEVGGKSVVLPGESVIMGFCANGEPKDMFEVSDCMVGATPCLVKYYHDGEVPEAKRSFFSFAQYVDQLEQGKRKLIRLNLEGGLRSETDAIQQSVNNANPIVKVFIGGNVDASQSSESVFTSDVYVEDHIQFPEQVSEMSLSIRAPATASSLLSQHGGCGGSGGTCGIQKIKDRLIIKLQQSSPTANLNSINLQNDAGLQSLALFDSGSVNGLSSVYKASTMLSGVLSVPSSTGNNCFVQIKGVSNNIEVNDEFPCELHYPSGTRSESEVLNEIRASRTQVNTPKNIANIESADPFAAVSYSNTGGNDEVQKHVQLAYFPSWKDTFYSMKNFDGSKVGAFQDIREESLLAKIPNTFNHVAITFVRPDLEYAAGSYDLSQTGLAFQSDFDSVKEAIKSLQARGMKVYLSLGGSINDDWSMVSGNSGASLKALAVDMGVDGYELHYIASSKLSNSALRSKADVVQEYAEVIRALDGMKSQIDSDFELAISVSGIGFDKVEEIREIGKGANKQIVANPLQSFWSERIDSGLERLVFEKLHSENLNPQDVFALANVRLEGFVSQRFSTSQAISDMRLALAGDPSNYSRDNPSGKTLVIPFTVTLSPRKDRYTGVELIVEHQITTPSGAVSRVQVDNRACVEQATVRFDQYGRAIDPNSSSIASGGLESHTLLYYFETVITSFPPANGSTGFKNGIAVWHIADFDSATPQGTCGAFGTAGDPRKIVQSFAGRFGVGNAANHIYVPVFNEYEFVASQIR